MPNLSRPYGTLTSRYAFPALKRRAIVEKSLRDSAAQNLICARFTPSDQIGLDEFLHCPIVL